MSSFWYDAHPLAGSSRAPLRIYSGLRALIQILFRGAGPMIVLVADFFVVLFIIAFALAMMGLIWALDRV